MDREMRIRLIMSALDGASGPVRKLAQASSKLKRAIGDNEKAIRGLEKAQAQVGSYRLVRGELGANAAAYRKARAAAAQLKVEYDALEKPTRAQARALRAAERASDRARQTYRMQADRLKVLRQAFRDAGGSARALGGFEDQLKARIARATAAIVDQRRELDRLGKRQQHAMGAKARSEALSNRSRNLAMGGAVTMGAGAVMTAPLVEGARQAMSFEDAMVDLNKVANATPAQLRRLAADFTDLSRTLPFTRAELAAIGADLRRSGVGNDELKAATRQAAELGVALGMAPEEAGAMASKWRSAYKMTRREIQMTGDAVNEITNRFGGNVGDIAGIVTRSGAFASASGVNAGTVAAIAGSMNSAGVGEEIGATGLKNLILALGKGEAATQGQRKAWQALGLEATAMSKALRKDAGGAITLVMDRLAALPDFQRAAMMDQLFGSESIGAIAPLLSDLDGLKQRLALVRTEGQYAGSAARELTGELGKTSTQLRIAANERQNAFGALGESILPEVRELSRFLGAVAGGLGRFAAAHPALVKIFAVVALLAVGVGALMIAVAAILAPFAALTAIAGALGVSVGAIMLPVLLVAAAIAAAVAVGYLLWRNWDVLKAKALELVAWFRNLPAMFLAIGKAIVTGLIDGFKSQFPLLTKIVQAHAQLMPGPMKRALGIRSPSRVFAAIGGDVMDGLALGLQRGRDGPIGGVTGTAAAMAAAMGLAVAPAGAAAFAFRSPPAAGSGPSPAAAPIVVQVHIHNPAPGVDGQALGRQAGQAAAAALAARGVNRRSYGNDSDGD